MAFGVEEFDARAVAENRLGEVRETRESVCFCGCFPEISRAWATVDDSLFLWRFDVDDDVPIELTEEFNGQPIVCVGLADPREGVL